MRRIAYGLGLLAICLCGFGGWGLFTTSGQQQFDEMAGVIPMLFGCAGIVAALLAMILFVVATGRESDRKLNLSIQTSSLIPLIP